MDECEDSSACTGPSECVNIEGSFQCVCDLGYTNEGTQCLGGLLKNRAKYCSHTSFYVSNCMG